MEHNKTQNYSWNKIALHKPQVVLPRLKGGVLKAFYDKVHFFLFKVESANLRWVLIRNELVNQIDVIKHNWSFKGIFANKVPLFGCRTQGLCFCYLPNINVHGIILSEKYWIIQITMICMVMIFHMHM